MRTAILLCAGLAGCATDTATIQAISDIHAKQRPTLSVTCPAGGCSVEYSDPRDRQIRMPTNGWDAVTAVAGSVERVVSGAVVPGVIGAVAVHGFKAVRDAGAGGNVSNTTTTTTSTDTTNTASGAGSSTGGDGNYEQIGPDSQNTTSGDTVTTTTTDSHDATATPTVVNAPAPVIVNPVVVQVPAGTAP